MNRLLAAGVLAGTVVFMVTWPRTVSPHGSLTTTVLFDREIVRILNARCVMCHVDNGLSFPLVTYEQTWLQGRAMRSSVLRRHMPPWSAVAGYGEFINDNRLTLRESQFLVSWVEGLGPRNAGRVFLNVVDPTAAAPQEVRATTHANHWRLGQPDLTLDVAAGNQRSGIRRAVVDLTLTSARQVRALEFMPGDRRAVSAAVFSVEGTGQWLGSWTPWHPFVSLPDGAAYRLPARSRIVVDVQYRGTSDARIDRGTLGVFFSNAPASKTATDLVLDARPSAGTQALKGHARLSRDTVVWAIQPEIVPGLSSIEVSARRPDGGTDVLLALTDPSIEWPTPYLLKTPRRLARGTEVLVVARPSASLPRLLRVRISKYPGLELRLAIQSTRTTEKQNVPVSVLEFESPQTIAVVVLEEWSKKLDIARRELRRQCIRIWDVNISVPAGNALFDISRVVRHWIDADVLEHDHRRTTLDNAEEDVVRFGPLKRDVEPEQVAIKRQRGGDTPNDEERRNAGNVWFSHASSWGGSPDPPSTELVGCRLRPASDRRPSARSGSSLSPAMTDSSRDRHRCIWRTRQSLCRR